MKTKTTTKITTMTMVKYMGGGGHGRKRRGVAPLLS